MFQNTLFGYLTERRLHLASQYLQDTEETVAEIAHRMGYSSPQHFHTQFKKHFGLTPNEWRSR
jgi:AraC family transcriptional regulator, transcriptional activator of the genes for pyochelin and ferripyochelin receptors